MALSTRFLIILFFTFMPHFALGDTKLKLFDGMGKSIQDSFSGANILYHLTAVASPTLMIKSGLDSRVYDTFKDNCADAAWPGAIIGSGAGALTAGLWLYYSGDSSLHQEESIGAAFAIAQSSLVTLSYVTLLKSFTGRSHPTNTSSLSSQDQSEQFEFGFKRWGIGYGWPSGHVSHTVAVSTALIYYYPNKTWLKWAGVGLSTYMLYTISAFHSGQMHWFSDGVSGALMGYAIGSSVGKNMRSQFDGVAAGDTSSFDWKSDLISNFIPVVSSDYFGAVTSFQF